MPERKGANDDRRDDPRFSCGGQVTISCLPSDGIVLPGKIRDVSLGGCCVDTTLPIARGARAELVVRVNAASFRAVGEVRAIRGHSGALLGTALPPESSGGSPGVSAEPDDGASTGKDPREEERLLVGPVDLFG